MKVLAPRRRLGRGSAVWVGWGTFVCTGCGFGVGGWGVGLGLGGSVFFGLRRAFRFGFFGGHGGMG